MDSYPEDFRDPPSYPCLHAIESFAKQHIPESDLSVRARHKIDKFKKEDLGNSGKTKISHVSRNGTFLLTVVGLRILQTGMGSQQVRPQNGKINKGPVRPAKTRVSLGFRPVCSESSLSTGRNLGSLASH